MDFGSIISLFSYSASTTSAVASRPFTVGFFLTLLGRLIYEAQLAATGQMNYASFGSLAEIQGMNLPLWMISETVIFLLALLMAAEWYAEYNEDLRVMLEDAKTNFVKPGVNGLLQFGMVQGQSAAILGLMAYHLSPETMAWLASFGSGVAVADLSVDGSTNQEVLLAAFGWVISAVAAGWALLMAAGTWVIATLRQAVVDLLEDLDDGDSLGLIKLLGLAEGGWTATLTLVLIFAPLLALLLTGLTVLSLFLIRKWFERREERSRVPCESCGTGIFPTALFCHNCRQPNQNPQQVGLFGQVKATPATDRTVHRLNLIARKRCPVCATRLPAKAIRQNCTACATATFADVSDLNVYLRTLDKKLPMTLIVCGVLGAIPLVGLVPGIVYYRLSLIASLRTYIPSAVGCMTRWGIRLASGVLIMLQPFFLGWLTLPAMALLNYVVYRQVLRAGIGGLPQRVEGDGVVVMAAAAGAGAARISVPLPAMPEPETPASTQRDASIPAQVQCAACGEANPAGNRFCMACGQGLNA